MDDRIDSLEKRVARIEAALVSQRITPPPERSAQPRPPLIASPAAPSAAPAPARAAVETERYVGGRILLAVGAIALLLGVAFFLKYAFDNGWIGPAGRVAIGLIAGAAMLLGSEQLRSKGQVIFAQGLTALGAGVLYLSLWAAGNGFALIPISLSFIAMCGVTALLILLAVRRDSEVTATWGLLGGFLTPVLNVGPQPSFVTLFTYVALLDAAILFVPRGRSWTRIAAVAFVFTQLYLFTDMTFLTKHPAAGLAFATAYLVLFTARPVMKALQHQALATAEGVIVILAGIAYYAALHSQLYDAHRIILIAAIVVLAAIYLSLARWSIDGSRMLFAALALALVTGGIAVAFSGATVTPLWAIEGALLAWAGLRSKSRIAQLFAIAAFALGLLHMFLIPPESGRPFLNDRFITLILFGLSLGATRFVAVRYAAGDSSIVTFSRLAEIGAHVFILTAFSYELFALGHGNELWLTLFWLLYAAALLVVGFARNSIFVRVEALALLGAAVLKTFVVDLSEVDPAVRIVSFLVLGLVLLAASYLYLRSLQTASVTKR